MKSYVEYFDWYIILLEIVYIIIGSAGLWLISKRLFNQYSAQLNTLITFIILILYTKLSAFSGLLPSFPDTAGFADLVELSHVENLSLGVKLYFIISFPMRFLSFNQLELFLVLQQFLMTISAMLIWKGWQIHANINNSEAGSFGVYMFFILCYPSVLLFVTIPLREFLMVFGFSIFLYGLSQYIHHGKITWILVGSVVTIFIRPQLVILYPLLVVVAKQNNLFKLSIIGGLLLLAAIPVFEWLTGYRFSPEFFSLLRERGTSHYSDSGMTYGAVLWHSYFDILLDLPQLTLQFILSPLPILHAVNPLSLTFIFIDLLVVLFLLFGALSVKMRAAKPYLLMFLLAAVVFSIWEFYIGGAVRHRMPLILMMIPLASSYYTLLIKRILNKYRGQYGS